MRPLMEAEEKHDCSHCNQKPGEACTAKSGKVAAEPHAARITTWFAKGVESGAIRTVRL
jgi:hypothetical protein